MELDTLIRTRVTSAEKQASIAKASAWGLNLSEYVRMLLTLQEPPKQVTDVAWDTYSKLSETYGQLNQIGSSLKQMSRIANTQDKLPNHLSQELQKLDKILRDLQQIVLEVRSQIDDDV
jgi:chemotaxis protein histidine kinase CheA